MENKVQRIMEPVMVLALASVVVFGVLIAGSARSQDDETFVDRCARFVPISACSQAYDRRASDPSGFAELKQQLASVEEKEKTLPPFYRTILKN